MSRNKRFKIKQKQKLKRRKRRARLREEKRNPDEYFFGKYYVAK